MRGRGAFDQLNYHEQVIRRFVEQWPAPDLSDYLSATTPGYHLALAAFAEYAGESAVALRLAGEREDADLQRADQPSAARDLAGIHRHSG